LPLKRKNKMKNKVTIIGFGTMGKAIAQALKKNDSRIKISTVDLKDSMESVQKADYVVLAVKPQEAKEVIEEMRKTGLNKKAIVFSIMAGVSLKKITTLSGHKKIVRLMPNLALSIAGWKATGLTLAEKQKAQKFLNKLTENFEVKKEEALDKITALSGSGPAYFFLLAQAIEETAKKLGFSKEEAKKLTARTFSASFSLAKDSDYANLIKKVTSKGGTTEVALKVFKQKKFAKIVEKAIFAAYKRAKELSR